MRFYIALWISKLAMKTQKLLGMNASYFPGKLAIRICPNFLGIIDKPKTVITVTGTNGKTTCCNLILDILTDNGYDVLNNKAGSNVDAGIASSLISDSNMSGKIRKSIAVFEVDERSSIKIYPFVHPDYAICTNLFRDSIERNAHTEFIVSIINKGIPDDTHMFLNADDPISSQLKSDNKRTYFSIGRLATDREECVNIINDMRSCPLCHSKLDYEYVRYHHIGKMHCSNPSCDFKSPTPDYLANSYFDDGYFTVQGPDGEERYPLISRSIYNTYNQVTVVSLLRTFGLSPMAIAKSFEHTGVVESRFTSMEANGIEIITNMTKGQNPVAASIVFDYVKSEEGKKELIIMVDDLGYKKTTENMTWIFDADYELLNDDSISKIIVAGVRLHDHHLRLLLAGIPEEKIAVVQDEHDAPSCLKLDGTDRIFILHDLTLPTITKDVKNAVIDEINRRAAK